MLFPGRERDKLLALVWKLKYSKHVFLKINGSFLCEMQCKQALEISS